MSLDKKKLLFGHFFCWRMMYENKLGLILLLLMAINWTCQESHSKISHSDPKNETFIYTFQIISQKMDNLFVYVMTALDVLFYYLLVLYFFSNMLQIISWKYPCFINATSNLVHKSRKYCILFWLINEEKNDMIIIF